MMTNQDNNSKPSHYDSQTKEDKRLDLAPIRGEDWTKVIGKRVVSKDGLDMGTIIVDDDKDYETSHSIPSNMATVKGLAFQRTRSINLIRKTSTSLTERK
jgi:hypothetical protein